MMRLSISEAITMYNESELAELGAAADAFLMTKHPPNERTYRIERNINYTNVCESQCLFCAFCCKKDEHRAFILDEKTIIQKIDETVQMGGDRILLQGGLNPDLPLKWYENLIQTIRCSFPQIVIHAFSPTEIVYFSKRFGISAKSILQRFQAAGLDSLPGGGGEILVDRVRSELSPHKAMSQEWLDVCRIWHKMGGRGSVTMMFGHIETIQERFEHLEKIRQLQDETGGFTAFIPWTFQPGNSPLSQLPKTSSFDYLKMVALSRLFLDNVTTIQSSWVTQGLQIGVLGLSFGADDLGSILLEENVVAAAGTCYKSTEQEFCDAIKRAGYVPRKRQSIEVR
ncbi:MAG: cyclic dehypoxanthinyl futalosine synthase [Thermoguttaceae bacterium]